MFGNHFKIFFLFSLVLAIGCVYSKSGPAPSPEEPSPKNTEGEATPTGSATEEKPQNTPGMAEGTETGAVDLSGLKGIGIRLDNNFSTNGKFRIEVLYPTPEVAKSQLESMSCQVVSPSGITCTCPDSGVTPGVSGILDVAIDIDSSGSNISADDKPASDPTGKRLVAAQAAVDELLTGENRIAAFDFGTQYCVAPVSTSCPDANPDSALYRSLVTLGVTNRFADYTGVSGKEGLKIVISKAVTQAFRGTPLYDSLWEVMNNISTAAARNSTKLVLLFSDGMPLGNARTEAEVCGKARALGVGIFAVGYGQASSRDPLMDPEAVRVLQRLASCAPIGTYLAIEDIAEISSKVADLGKGIVQGHLDLSCSIPPLVLPGLDPSKVVNGKVLMKFLNLSDLKEILFDFLPPR